MSQASLLAEIKDKNHVFSFMQSQASPALNVDKDILLYLEGLSVSFDGFKAINELNLYIRDGELRCIIGPNGAGKTTMMDIITGKLNPIAVPPGSVKPLTCWNWMNLPSLRPGLVASSRNRQCLSFSAWRKT